MKSSPFSHIIKTNVKHGIMFKIFLNEIDTIDFLDFERLPHLKANEALVIGGFGAITYLLASGHF